MRGTGTRTTLDAAVTLPLLVALALLAPVRSAEACSCIARSPRQYVEQAELVFVARAGKERTAGKRSVQPLAVLHVLKGKPGRVFELVRPAGPISTCDRRFNDGEVALVLVSQGAVSVCGGNHDLRAVQLEQMATYLGLGTTPVGAPDLEAVRAALEAALRGYLHDRPTVPVTFAPLAGRRARVGTSTLIFGDRRLKHAIDLRQAVASGPLVFVAGFYGHEGYAFRALLSRAAGPGGKATFETLARWGAERSAASPLPNIGPRR